MKDKINIDSFQVDELSDLQLHTTNGGGIIGDALDYVGRVAGTCVGMVLCYAKCATNMLGMTEPKPSK